jgi:hypothetical protein
MSSKDKKEKKISIPKKEGVSIEQGATEYMLDVKTMGAMVIDGYSNGVCTQMDMEYAREVIGESTEAIKRGDLSNLEEMLYAQAIALNLMFVSLSRRASIQTNVDIRSSITNLALKSQNQSRNTLQTLINLKQPASTHFIKQANISHGHQQINNEEQKYSLENLSNRTNELLEARNGQRLDGREKAEAERVNTVLETLGEVHGRKDT